MTHSLKPSVANLLGDIRALIESARGKVAQVVNAGLVTLYWNIGDRIRREILGDKRAKYGEKIVQALSERLTLEYGEGFRSPNLFRMLKFAEVFPDPKIVAALRQQLTWTHLKTIIPIKDPLKRDFYAEMCRIEGWSTRALEKKIAGMLFERTAFSKQPEKLAVLELKKLREDDKLSADLVFRDPSGKGRGSRHTPGDGGVHPGVGRRIHVRGAPEEASHRDQGLLSGSSLLPPQAQMLGGHRAQAR